MHNDIFSEISFVIIAATLIALVMRKLRQPLIIGHILTGILLGPTVFGLLKSTEPLELMGNFGVALLLFLVGLGLNPRVIKEVGKVSLLTGAGQIVLTSLAAFGIAQLFGYSTTSAIYIAVALTFSSTIIILKLLTDKKEHNKLYGKISIGFLLVQDLVATIALVAAAASADGDLSLSKLFWLLVKGFFMLVGVFIFTHAVLRPMSNFLSKSQELLFLFSIAWGFCIATIYYETGFSLEVGALIAGIALSTMHYSQEVASRLRPLRDFFIVVFFISLGSKLDLSDFSTVIWQIIAFSALVLILKPLIVMGIMGALGYTKKTGYKAGLAIAQISEFSLIFILLGYNNNQIDAQVVSMVTIVGLITIAASSYMITYADSLFAIFARYLQPFERKTVKVEHDGITNYEAILLGFRRGGSEYVKVLTKLSTRYLVIDYDPEAIDELDRKDVPYIYGDVTDPELLDELDMSKTKLIISHINDHDTNRFIVEYMQEVNPAAVVICHADNAHEATILYGLGASYVILPHYIGTEKISSFIRRYGFKKSEYNKYRERHLEQLQQSYEAEEVAIQ